MLPRLHDPLPHMLQLPVLPPLTQVRVTLLQQYPLAVEDVTMVDGPDTPEPVVCV